MPNKIFDKIMHDDGLFNIRRESCSENGIGADISKSLLDENGDLNNEKVIILKLDDYYSSRNMPNPPPSPDYLVIIQCCDGSIDGYIIELRNTKSTRNVRQKDISKKFQTIADDFFGIKYKHIFTSDDGGIIFNNLKLYLVTDPLGINKSSGDSYKKNTKGSVLDAYGSMRPIKIGKKGYVIEPILPDPAIESC